MAVGRNVCWLVFFSSPFHYLQAGLIGHFSNLDIRAMGLIAIGQLDKILGFTFEDDRHPFVHIAVIGFVSCIHISPFIY